MIEADRRPGILARMLGSMLKTAREIVGLSYDEAATRLGREADWLIRVETGFVVPTPEDVARILVDYGVREASSADRMIDLARRAGAAPSWLAPHTSRLTANNRDVLLIEAESTLAQVHGFLLMPQLVQTEEYFREMAPAVYPECDVDQEWDLLSHRQDHKPVGVTRLLDVMIDAETLKLRGKPEIMACQVRHLIALGDSQHATVRVIPAGTRIWEKRVHNFDVLSFAGTTDRIGVCYYPILGAELAHGDLYDAWTAIERAAADPAESRAILEHRLAELS
ncbi:MAG TPA: Scr1 family TA system antitoxin-like transcriptional regulator [Trebonia sp.]|nr:Scr1 family TA system antitoxin-like transcriptional regulator [Trebonia sp.]